MKGIPIVKNLILWCHQVKVALAMVKLNPRQDWERERERSSLQKLTTLTLTWRRPSGCPSCMQRRRKRKKRNGSQPCRWLTHRPKWQRKRVEEKICSKTWTFAGPRKISSQLKLCFWILPIIVTVQRMIWKSKVKPLCATTATFTWWVCLQWGSTWPTTTWTRLNVMLTSGQSSNGWLWKNAKEFAAPCARYRLKIFLTCCNTLGSPTRKWTSPILTSSISNLKGKGWALTAARLAWVTTVCFVILARKARSCSKSTWGKFTIYGSTLKHRHHCQAIEDLTARSQSVQSATNGLAEFRTWKDTSCSLIRRENSSSVITVPRGSGALRTWRSMSPGFMWISQKTRPLRQTQRLKRTKIWLSRPILR